MSDKIEKFIASMSLAFPKRFEDERQQVEWFKTWERALKPFDPWVVEAAAARIIDNRTERSFPLVSEVRKACYEVIDVERASNPQMAVKHEQQHGDPYALADALINCELGREAARSEPCWLLALHDFCRDNRRLPTGQEIARCKRVAAEFEVRYRECVRRETVDGKPFPDGRKWEPFAEAIIRRREGMRKRLIGRAAA
jgi:hypothetical protein